MGTMQTSLKRPSLSDEAISRFVDPRTGQRLRPLGVVGGRTVWPMMGASPDDPSDPDNEDEDKETKDKDTGSEGKIVALEEEKNRHVRRRTEAERERDALKQELEEIRGKDKSEVEKMTERVTTLESENTSLKEALRSQRLENAFLSDNTYSWHNPGRALALADLSEVEIDEDGKVHGLKAALDKLAKSDAYLLKKESAEDDEEDLPNTKVTNKSKKDKTKDKAQDSALLQKYPALRR
jgi:hypothetical protein